MNELLSSKVSKSDENETKKRKIISLPVMCAFAACEKGIEMSVY
jgi:hypothetical protein